MPQIKGKECPKSSLKHNVLENGALLHSFQKGSLTVETALVLPWFLFAMVTVLFLFRVLQIQYMVGESLDKAVAETALLGEGIPKETENKVKLLFYAELKKQDCPFSMIALKIAGFSWNGSVVDESQIQMKVKYKIKMPGWILKNRMLEVTESSWCRRWTGMSGKGEEAGNEDWVYITPEGKVYHKSRECTYLKLSIQSAGVEKAARYRACEICTEGNKVPSRIYITEEGDCYHISISCRGLKRTIYMIPVKQAKGRSPCSRCGGG